MSFSVYSDGEVKEKLSVLFGAKCAYCEGDYSRTSPVDIEHYRPKGAVVTPDGTLRFPGYWWLASDWENLLPSCIDCNRSRWHEVEGNSYKYGKENLFPLANNGIPATSADGVALEEPLLVDPTADDPTTHLAFDFVSSPRGILESVAIPVVSAHGAEDARGKTSIDTYGLNRPSLVRSRRRRINELRSAIGGIEDLLQLAQAETDPEKIDTIRAMVRKRVRILTRDYLHWSCEYAAACRAYYRKWLAGYRAAA